MTGLPLLSESKASQRTILQAWNNIFKTMQRLQDENHQVSMFLNRTRAASTEKHHKKSVLDLLQQHPKKETNKTSSREQHSWRRIAFSDTGYARTSHLRKEHSWIIEALSVAKKKIFQQIHQWNNIIDSAQRSKRPQKKLFFFCLCFFVCLFFLNTFVERATFLIHNSVFFFFVAHLQASSSF